MNFLRSRLLIHISGAVFACELVYMILLNCGVKSLWWAALTAPLVGLASEIYDMVNEDSY